VRLIYWLLPPSKPAHLLLQFGEGGGFTASCLLRRVFSPTERYHLTTRELELQTLKTAAFEVGHGGDPGEGTRGGRSAFCEPAVPPRRCLSLFDDVQLPTLITPKRLKAPPRKREKVPPPSGDHEAPASRLSRARMPATVEGVPFVADADLATERATTEKAIAAFSALADRLDAPDQAPYVGNILLL